MIKIKAANIQVTLGIYKSSDDSMNMMAHDRVGPDQDLLTLIQFQTAITEQEFDDMLMTIGTPSKSQ